MFEYHEISLSLCLWIPRWYLNQFVCGYQADIWISRSVCLWISSWYLNTKKYHGQFVCRYQVIFECREISRSICFRIFSWCLSIMKYHCQFVCGYQVDIWISRNIAVNAFVDTWFILKYHEVFHLIFEYHEVSHLIFEYHEISRRIVSMPMAHLSRESDSPNLCSRAHECEPRTKIPTSILINTL